MTVKEAAAEIGVSLSKTYELIKERKLPSYRVGARIVVRSEDVDRFIRRARRDARKPRLRTALRHIRLDGPGTA